LEYHFVFSSLPQILDTNFRAMNINIELTTQSRLKDVDFDNLPFGRTFSDHVFIADYINGEWQDFRIVPFGDMAISPANMALHYGQSIFEGIKAQIHQDGYPVIFRPDANLRRLNTSAERMAMPAIPEEIFFGGLDQLLKIDRAWFPTSPSSSLYIRPLLFAMDGFIGVRSSESFRFIIMTGPTGPYYDHPVKLWVETHYVRASRGGVGFAKTAGNYAASIMPANEARKKGYDQVLWLDGLEYKYLQECGTMNIFCVIGDTVLTPPTTDSILAGVTRDSLVSLWRDQGVKVEERPISIDEIVEAHRTGELKEMFGVGTAAVISHVSELMYEGKQMVLPPVESRKYSPAMKRYFEDLKGGRVPDNHNWLYAPTTTRELITV
jgi:branched-chain amino acid aminotransferase